VPQLIPGGLEVTLPVPVPARATERVNVPVWSTTVSVVLAVAPALSVAVIVVVPELTPLASPDPSMLATAVLLLAHATPGPVIVTGVEALVLVPVPNWPQSFAPQHRTAPPPRSAQL
jgi:hypothetical protein